MKINKKNKKYFFLYVIIVLLSYPIIFNFSNNKIVSYNDNEVTDSYTVTLTLKYNSLNEKFDKLEDFVSNLNNEIYLKRKNLKVSTPDIYRRTTSEDNTSIRSSDNFLVFINLYDNYFQVPFTPMKQIINVKKLTEDMKNQDNKFCKEIKFIKSKTIEIDTFHLTIISNIQQRVNNYDIKNLAIPFKKCFKHTLISNQNIMIDYLTNFYLMSKNKNDLMLDKYLSQNSGILFPENKKQYLKDQISSIPELFFSDLEKNFFVINYTGPYNYTQIQKYSRTFNIYAISIVLTLLISFLLSYPIYFFRDAIKLLKKVLN
jgi:hypothetical protein